jgi:alanyl-tRNA synthetase
VLRRLLRRAVTRGRSKQTLAIREPFLVVVANTLIEQYASHYPELRERRDAIARVLSQEESTFAQTFEGGVVRLEELIRSGGGLSGDDAFVLHDTFGFPIELTEEIAAERGVTVDREGFERAMNEQRSRARAASKFAKTGDATSVPWNDWTEGDHSQFLGYDVLNASGLFVRRWRERGEELEVVLDRTPCYAESGGQVADRGVLTAGATDSNQAAVVAHLTHVYKEDDAIVHRVRFERGTRDALLMAGREGQLSARIDAGHRLPTMRHHTATHLLHAALRAELGTHVHQAGSLVAPDRLRFDYSHFEAPSREQLERIEQRINQWVLADREVRWEILPLEEARRRGAMALFGEKYGAEVRMVTVEGLAEAGIAASLELCGGTHVHRTGEIGAFTITGESAIASGVRRIEALCGLEAMRHFRSERELLARAAASLQASPSQVPEQVEKLRAELDQLRKAEAKHQRGGLEAEMTRLAEGASPAREGRWIVAKIESAADPNALREAADSLRGRLKRGAALLAIAGEGKLTFVAAVTDDLVSEKKLNASDLVKAVAGVAGGSGGGKPHLALAGGKDPSKLGAALDEARRRMAEALSA